MKNVDWTAIIIFALFCFLVLGIFVCAAINPALLNS